jgi:hypothetical protein
MAQENNLNVTQLLIDVLLETLQPAEPCHSVIDKHAVENSLRGASAGHSTNPKRGQGTPNSLECPAYGLSRISGLGKLSESAC